MSGPKSSRYTLTPEQRRILTEQRAIERRKSIASENIKRNNKIMVSVLKISWANNRTVPGISFAFMNGNPNKFYRMEDINLD